MSTLPATPLAPTPTSTPVSTATSTPGRTLSRRGALRVAGGAGVVAGVAGVAATASPAAAAVVDYKPGRYRATKIMSRRNRHLINRFTPGATPRLTAEVKAAGSAVAWFENQLATAYDGTADTVADWWPDLHLDANTIWQRQTQGIRGSWEVMQDYSRRQAVRRIMSPKPVLEVMTDFWENHLHVPAVGDAQAMWRASYGDVIRRRALGRFEDMLAEAIVHPAMMIYLDGATSTKSHPNENLGRELLELHTVGVGNYSEDDVKSSARILTGYRVDVWRTWAASYRTTDHWTGPVAVKEFSDPNAAADGRPVTDRYLRWLAHHPQTARRLAQKLAVKFVSDNPPSALIDQLAAVYLANDTQIIPVLRAIIASPYFAAAQGAKLRDPAEDVIATYRVLDVVLAAPTTANDAANAIAWQTQSLGLVPLTWPRPDGQPLTNDPWASPSRAMASAGLHMQMAGKWWPTMGITYRTPASWAPTFPITFRDLVDHLSRSVLQRLSTKVLLQACCEAVEVDPGLVITNANHAVLTWKFPKLMVTLLDNPTHYQR